MLNPEFIRSILPKRITELYAQIEDDMLRDVARRIKKANYATDTAKWQLAKAKDMSILYKDLNQTMQKYTGKTAMEVRQTLMDAGIRSAEWDKEIYARALEAEGIDAATADPKMMSYITGEKRAVAPYLREVMEAATRNAQTMFNLTNTRAIQGAQMTFSNIVDKAYLSLQTGTMTFDQAMRSAITELANQGVQVVNYASGYRCSMEAATKANIRTAANQACANLAEKHMELIGCSLVETTSHAGARPSHAVWQGRVFYWEGKGEPNTKYPPFLATTGYGTAAGLCGVNCRHSFYPFFEGLSEQTFERDPAKRLGIDNDELYAQTQKQRALERKVRAAKKEQVIADEMGDQGALSAAKAKTAKAQKELRDYVDKHEYLQRDYTSEGIGKKLPAKVKKSELTPPAPAAKPTPAPAPAPVRTGKQPSYPMLNKEFTSKQDERMEPYTRKLAKQRGMSLEQYEAERDARIKEITRDASTVVRRNSKDAMQVLKDGRFKTQFEIGRSDGTYDPGLRSEFENKLFGAPHDLDSKERPVYGMLWDDSVVHSGGQYGHVVFELDREAIGSRTTLTFGDSLDFADSNSYGRATFLNNPTGHIAPFEDNDILDFENLKDVTDFARYAEIQVHGGVATSDVKRVWIPASEKDNPYGEYSELRQFLEKSGTPWGYYSKKGKEIIL
jgi:hypothetical protein